MTTENSSQETASTGAASGDTTTTSTPSTPAPENTGSGAEGGQNASASTDAAANTAAAPTYTPNFKFKAFGKEQEIEEHYRSLITNKEMEEKVRKLHEKAYAMEKFQENERKLKGDFEGYRQQAEPNLKAMAHFNNLLKNKDWDNFFGGLKIPDEELFNYVEKKLQLRNLPPEQKAEFERQALVRQQNYRYEQDLAETQKQYQQLATETRSMQLDSILSRSDVSSQAEQVDRAYGESGAFRNLVIEEAMNHYHRTGEDLPADKAVQMTLQKYGRFMQAQTPGASSAGAVINPEAAPQNAAPAKAPIIPHVGGSARSPVKKQPTSIADLKAMAAKL